MMSENQAYRWQNAACNEGQGSRPPHRVDRSVVDGEILEWEQLKERFDDETSLIRELTDLFRSDLDGKLQALHSAHQAADWQTIENLAHTMRGAVANFDSPASVQLLLRLELDARTGNTGALTERIIEIERVLRRLLDLLESELKQEEARPPLS